MNQGFTIIKAHPHDAARKHYFDESVATWLHCTSRCVWRAYLAGDQYEHRTGWIEERLQLLARCFSVEAAGYAVMSNHAHVIHRMQPSLPDSWSADAPCARRLSFR